MATIESTYFKQEPIREVDFAAVTANYTAIGAPLNLYTRLIYFGSTLNEDVYISYGNDPTMLDDNHRIFASSFRLLDLNTNRDYNLPGWYVPKGTQLWIKAVGALPTQGVFVLESSYGRN